MKRSIIGRESSYSQQKFKEEEKLYQSYRTSADGMSPTLKKRSHHRQTKNFRTQFQVSINDNEQEVDRTGTRSNTIRENLKDYLLQMVEDKEL